ncbi:hypothetical protein C0030_003495 [Candidatus Liberibacter solanacearum]|uniref:Uncharacterized protein n=1 Tax=Candidatus Liberibacter solanacearum TaxID=556287 RepID=A0A424FM71_9HYPH|nr:hypothetical protein [Candidatus Liberibacter solanacearum]RPD37234.1 hypothetical protein C0030_003495 [Candidatus Liberibacter solanacearum]
MFIDYLFGIVLSGYFGLACLLLWDIIKMNNTIACLNKKRLKLFSKFSKTQGKAFCRLVIEKFHNTYSTTFNLKNHISYNININI